MALGLLGTATFYGAYGWVVAATVAGALTLGQMTLYVLLFKQGQGAVTACPPSAACMRTTSPLSPLYDYLGHPVTAVGGMVTCGPRPEEGLVVEGVGFTYPGAEIPALSAVSFQLRPGESLALVGENGFSAGWPPSVPGRSRRWAGGRGRFSSL